MDKEEMAMSQRSTLAPSDHTKPISNGESASFLQKRDCSIQEFDKLIKSVSDSGSDETDRKKTGANPKADETEDIGISRKRLIRNRGSFTEKQPAEPREVRCTNANCSTVVRKENARLYKTKLFSELAYFCDDCNTAIRKKWVCPFCKAIYTDPGHSTNKDLNTWINCDSKKCRRWTHLECEGSHRMQDLKACLNDDNFKFFCSDCYETFRPQDVAKPHTEYSSSRPEHHAVAFTMADFKDLHKLTAASSKFAQLTNFPYFYLYSEAYQPIAKLVAEKSVSLLLTEAELVKDLERAGMEAGVHAPDLHHSLRKVTDGGAGKKKTARALASDGKY